MHHAPARRCRLFLSVRIEHVGNVVYEPLLSDAYLTMSTFGESVSTSHSTPTDPIEMNEVLNFHADVESNGENDDLLARLAAEDVRVEVLQTGPDGPVRICHARRPVLSLLELCGDPAQPTQLVLPLKHAKTGKLFQHDAQLLCTVTAAVWQSVGLRSVHATVTSESKPLEQPRAATNDPRALDQLEPVAAPEKAQSEIEPTAPSLVPSARGESTRLPKQWVPAATSPGRHQNCKDLKKIDAWDEPCWTKRYDLAAWRRQGHRTPPHGLRRLFLWIHHYSHRVHERRHKAQTERLLRKKEQRLHALAAPEPVSRPQSVAVPTRLPSPSPSPSPSPLLASIPPLASIHCPTRANYPRDHDRQIERG